MIMNKGKTQMNADIHTTTWKLQVWNATAKGAEVYPLEPAEQHHVDTMVDKYMHELMHRDGEYDY